MNGASKKDTIELLEAGIRYKVISHMNLVSEKQLHSGTEKRKGVEGHHILLTIDVEDWFQVENFKPWIPFETWDRQELRVEKNVHFLLDFFDELSLESKLRENIRATFFMLGWLAERLPHLVREIHQRGHEVASHGCFHRLPNKLSTEELTAELSDSKSMLEEILGEEVEGYRAPSFAINGEVLDKIEEAGYRYDSSYNSFALHGRYGRMDFLQSPRSGIAIQRTPGLFELPISNLNLGGQVLPWGGGAYFRLIPFAFFRHGIRRTIFRQGAYLFYIHPWEIDPGQPRVNGASPFRKFRHYTFLERTVKKLEAMARAFSDCAWVSCREYLENLSASHDH